MSARRFRTLALEAAARLQAAAVEDPRREAWLLLAAASGLSRASLMAAGDQLPDQDVAVRFETMLARRLAREPMAYVLGHKEFWSLTFRVEPGVLVPRPDSETMVEAALEQVADRRAPLRLLDLGTGSGCLLLALLSELPAAHGVGVDRDPTAVAVARGNAERLGLAARTMIVRGRWSEALRGPFDLIVSNPPYVRVADLPGLEPEVREHEPAGALLGGADGLEAYRALAPELARLVAPEGVVCLEHGLDQAAAIEALLGDAGLRWFGRKRDLAGHERVVIAK